MTNDGRTFRPASALLVGGVLMMTAGVAVLGTITIGLVAVIDSYWIWAFVGLGAISAALGVAGFDAMLKEATAPLITPKGKFRLSHFALVPVASHHYGISPAVAKGLGQNGVAQGDAGKDKNHHTVQRYVLALGGKRGYGLDFEPGDEGFMVIDGKNKIIPFGSATEKDFAVTPFVPVLMDPSQVDQDTWDTLRSFKKFKPGKSRIYYLAEPEASFIDWTWDHHAMIQHLWGLRGPLPDNNEAIADQAYLRARWLSAETEVNNMRYEKRMLQDSVQYSAEATAGSSRRRSVIAKAPNRAREPVDLDSERRYAE